MWCVQGLPNNMAMGFLSWNSSGNCYICKKNPTSLNVGVDLQDPKPDVYMPLSKAVIILARSLGHLKGSVSLHIQMPRSQTNCCNVLFIAFLSHLLFTLLKPFQGSALKLTD